jgi:three-Cys-motif partner protein
MPEKIKKTLTQRLSPIIDRYSPQLMKELIAVDPTCFFPADYWAPLKLYCFASYIHTCYVPIISQNKYVNDNYYFIDVLSNSGINLVSKCKDCIPPEDGCLNCRKKEKPKAHMPGSSLLAATANPPFKKMYFIDKDKKNLVVLEKRLNILKNNKLSETIFELKEGDCNTVIDEILEEIKSTGRPYHFLAFVDNQGFDADWNTIDKLLNCYSDLIINFPTSNIIRNLNIPKSENSLIRFLGCNQISEVGDNPLRYYINKILSKDKEVEVVSINTNAGFHYDLIIVTKKGAKFKPYITSLKKNIEENTAKEAERAFEILEGSQDILSRYFEE